MKGIRRERKKGHEECKGGEKGGGEIKPNMKKKEKKLKKTIDEGGREGGKLLIEMERPEGRVREAGRKKVRNEEEGRCKKGREEGEAVNG